MRLKLLPIILFLTLLISCSPKIDYHENSTVTKERKFSGYVFGTKDIPLLSGLNIIDEESTNFDTISGNITIASYFGEFTLDEVKDFYMITLPQVGFKLQEDNNSNISYRRKTDKLELSFTQDGDELTVKFLISSN
jgi:hypothetical protein